MSKHLNEIIRRLGYADSPCLKYKNKDYDPQTLTVHTSKVLNALSPFAAYMVDDEPFVLFFDELSNQDEQKEISKRIWNAQIPVAIFCGTSTIKIFNGCTLEQETHFITEVDTIQFSDIDENSPFSFWEISDHCFWGKYSKKFSGKRLNDALLENLTYLTDKLKSDYKILFATKLVLRLIFIRYLIDRGVDLDYSGFSSEVELSRSVLLSLLNDRISLYKLFAHLKNKFNGNLFELDNENPDSLTDAALKEIRDFLSADITTRSGQLSLFPLYDFNIIPVELISNIYEILLGKEARTKDNAFYTPKYLVDYILDMTVEKHIENNGSYKILDPSCGSGVFLVDSYRRMIERELNGELYTEDDDFLRDTLKNNIFGVDLNPSAIDVSIFSLYLAVLDYKNPKTLKQFPLPNLRGSNLLVCDFFDDDALSPLKSIQFDFIIGNPPWGSKDGMHMDYCRKHGYEQYMQNNDTCRAFIFRSKDFCQHNTTCCFVLKSKMLYMQKTPSREFRKFLLSNTKINRIIELSSVRKLIFKNADAPAIVLSYNFSDTNQEENRFEHISMKKNLFFQLFNIIVVEKNDVKSVLQKLLIENDWMWKTLVYGLTGDVDTIRRLKMTTKTLGESLENKHPDIKKGVGVQYNKGDKDAHHLLRRPLLDSSNVINHFALDERKTTPFSKLKIRRTPDSALFQAPYCLVRKGLNVTDYTMKAVYSETDFVFHEAVYAIKGSSNQKSLLLNVVGLLNSKLYAYFNLMLGSSLGIEREQRQTEEVLSFPFVFSEEIAKQVEHIQNIKKQDGCFIVPTDTDYEIDLLNQKILEEFGLTDNEYIDYALRIQIPQLTGKNDNDAKRTATIPDFEVYGKSFYDYLSEIFAGVGKYIQINLYPTIVKHYSAVEAIVLDEKPTEWFTVVDKNNKKQLAMGANLSAHKTNEMFYSVKDVLYFEEQSFYIIKPNYYKNWHPAIARLDIMEVTDQILTRKTGGKE
jgi:type I restriction-modification system DNA methylase subunit